MTLGRCWKDVFLRLQTYLRSVKGFPLQNFPPGLLVVLVVNFNDIIHVFLTNILILPCPPRKEHFGKT